jgi:hypothetical protein
MKVIAFILIAVLGLGALSLGLMGLRVLLFPASVANNMIDTAYDANRKVINADNAIYNYEWFKQQYQDIEASKKQLVNARTSLASFEAAAGDRKDWTFEDKNEHARLMTVVLGIQNNLESQIADYNARASMATRNIFEDSVLPSYIDALTFIRQ